MHGLCEPMHRQCAALLAETNAGLPDKGLNLSLEVSCIDLGFEIKCIGHSVLPRQI